MTGTQDLTLALGGAWSGSGGLARCPACRHQHPSLRLSEGKDGKILLHCYAGCAFDAVRAALRTLGVLVPSERRAAAPIPLTAASAPRSRYPVDSLGTLYPVVLAVQNLTEAPVEIAAQSALSAASACVQQIADVEHLAGKSPCVLFCLTVAQSGERKSACDHWVMKGIHDFQKQRIAALACVRKERKSDESEPPPAQIHTADVTFEGMAKLYEKGVSGLFLSSDEGGLFFGGVAMNKDNRLKTVCGLSKLWDGAPITRTRLGDGAVTLYERRLSCHLMAQPSAAASFVGDTVMKEQGFLPRFLIAWPESAIGSRLRVDRSPEAEAVVAAFAARTRDLLERFVSTEAAPHEGFPALRVLRLTEGASALMKRYYIAAETAQREGGTLFPIRMFASKATEQAARLAGVMTLFGDPCAQTVSEAALRDGIALSVYYLNEAARLFSGETALSGAYAEAETLRRWLYEKNEGRDFTLRCLLQRGPYAFRDKHKASEALEILEATGWVVKNPYGIGLDGRACKESWRVYPGVPPKPPEPLPAFTFIP